MKKERKLIRDLSKHLIHKMVEHDFTAWPPNCPGFTYQPKRPAKKTIDNGGEIIQTEATDK